jgi:hypothetical protein
MAPQGAMKPKRRITERCSLRLPKQVFASIETARAKRPGYLSRNSWIAEAIRDKLRKEGIDLPPEMRSSTDA